jgi:hypothetical protein
MQGEAGASLLGASLLAFSIRQRTSAYVSIRQHTSAYVSIRQHTSAYVSIRQHTSAYVSIRQHTSAGAGASLLGASLLALTSPRLRAHVLAFEGPLLCL